MLFGIRFINIMGIFLIMFTTTVYGLNIQTKTETQAEKEKLKLYYESGQYFKEIERQLVDAKDYLDRQLLQKRPNRLAVILDVDETALTNYHSLERLAFTNNMPAIIGVMMQAEAKPIVPVLQFYQHAINNKVAVFFISSRPNSPEFVAATTKNLKNAGYSTWEELVLKPLEREDQSVQEFKTITRRNITALGYDIVLNIGDQSADLEGGYAEARLRLPNPFYELS
ncbi:MAG: acid phosphatase [Proteobacteria bacterium]|nr:acid phosphatase [Pseudomonadota bacterium]